MMSKLWLSVFLLFIFTNYVLAEELKDDAKVDIEGIKKLLDQLEQSQLEALNSDFGTFTQDLSAALGSEEEGLKLYQSCVRKVEFEGKASDSNEWNEWKSKNAETLGDKNFKKGVMFQLRFLQLWTKAFKKSPLAQNEESLVALCFEIENFRLQIENEKKEGKKATDHFKKVLGTSLSGSYFSKAYRLQTLFKDMKGWDLTLLNAEEILDTLLMDHYRESMNPHLFDLWPKRLEFLDLKTKYESMSSEQKFSHENHLLSLQWKQAQDLKKFGLQNKAVNLMFNIVSKAPDHPQFESWTNEIRAILGIKSETAK